MISQDGLNLIKRYEGFRAEPYKCPAGIWTNGYGNTLGVTKDTPPVTKAVAEMQLRLNVERAQSAVIRLTRTNLAQGQTGALTSFIFNLGAGAYQRSTLRQKLNRGDYDGAAAQFGRWVYAGGRKLPGLVLRRA